MTPPSSAFEGARCRSFNPDMWYSNDQFEQLRAQVQCLSCPVMAACLQMGANETDGVWGGTTPDMRVRLAKGEPARISRFRGANDSPSMSELRRGRVPSQSTLQDASRLVRERILARATHL